MVVASKCYGLGLDELCSSHHPLVETACCAACCFALLPPTAPGGLPTLNVDVPRLLRVEYHKRMQAARMRRQHELENLLKSGKLPVGHCRVCGPVKAAAYQPMIRIVHVSQA